MVKLFFKFLTVLSSFLLLATASATAQSINSINENLECEIFDSVLSDWGMTGDDLVEASLFQSQCYIDRMKSRIGYYGVSESSQKSYFKEGRLAVEALDKAAIFDDTTRKRRDKIRDAVCYEWSRRIHFYGSWELDSCLFRIKSAYDTQIFAGGNLETPKNCESYMLLYDNLYRGGRNAVQDPFFENLDMETQTFISDRCESKN